MTKEEADVYRNILHMKESHDRLQVIFEELDKLAEGGYDRFVKGKGAKKLLNSLKEYKRWSDEQRRKKEANS